MQPDTSIAVQLESTATEPQAFLVRQSAFQGTLGELAYALRAGTVTPQQLDVLQLVKDYLTYFNTLASDDLNLASEALPKVAQIIELKLRLLLPRPPREEDPEEDLLEQALEAVTLLEELEEAIDFLRQRRLSRRIMLPAKTPRPSYPRAERPIKIKLPRLTELASRYSVSSYFEMAVERITQASAMKWLMNVLKSGRRGTLRELAEFDTWPVITVTFAGMLELFKEGKIRATQSEAYGEIELELAEPGEKQNAA